MKTNDLRNTGIAGTKGSLLFMAAVCALFFTRPAYGSGFQIPNQSLRAIGIAGATIAFTPGPESAYYNPANMSFLENSWAVETSLTTLWLPEVEYRDNRSPLFDGASDVEVFFMPQVHLASADYNDFRFGFALTYPYGLAKSWDYAYPGATARQFSLFVVEANPTLAYAPSDMLSVAGGLRFIYSEGEVSNGATNPPFATMSPLTKLDRTMDGDDLQVGYNLAATFRPTSPWHLAVTYRSKVDLELEGRATLTAVAGEIPVAGYYGSGELPITLPAVFSLATSYSFQDLTLEFAWSRTFWSDVEELDFRYTQSFLGTIFDGFDRPVRKDWEDSDALRFGVTYQLTKEFLTTLGFAIDSTPVPDDTVGFELPDSDAYMYGLGLQYKVSDALSMGISYMYYHTTSRAVASQPVGGLPGIDGNFSDGGAHAVTVGFITTF